MTNNDIAILNNISNKKIIGIANKTDLGHNFDEVKIEPYFNALVSISVKNNEGLTELEKTLVETVTQVSKNIDDIIIPNLRQTQLLEQILANMAKFDEGMAQNLPAEYLCIHLEESLRLLNTILGLDINTDILDAIFNNFCIGK